VADANLLKQTDVQPLADANSLKEADGQPAVDANSLKEADGQPAVAANSLEQKHWQVEKEVEMEEHLGPWQLGQEAATVAPLSMQQLSPCQAGSTLCLPSLHRSMRVLQEVAPQPLAVVPQGQAFARLHHS